MSESANYNLPLIRRIVKWFYKMFTKNWHCRIVSDKLL